MPGRNWLDGRHEAVLPTAYHPGFPAQQHANCVCSPLNLKERHASAAGPSERNVRNIVKLKHESARIELQQALPEAVSRTSAFPLPSNVTIWGHRVPLFNRPQETHSLSL